jgi:hypothetical protein
MAMAQHTSTIKLLIKTAYNGQGKESGKIFIANYVCFMQISPHHNCVCNFFLLIGLWNMIICQGVITPRWILIEMTREKLLGNFSIKIWRNFFKILTVFKKLKIFTKYNIWNFIDEKKLILLHKCFHPLHYFLPLFSWDVKNASRREIYKLLCIRR